jgi:hypothetical protein
MIPQTKNNKRSCISNIQVSIFYPAKWFKSESPGCWNALQSAMQSTTVLKINCGATCGCQLYLVVFTGAESSSVGRSFVLVSCLKFASKNFIPVSICQYDNEWAELWCETRRVIYVQYINTLIKVLSKGGPKYRWEIEMFYSKSQTHAKRDVWHIYEDQKSRCGGARFLSLFSRTERQNACFALLDAPITKYWLLILLFVFSRKCKNKMCVQNTTKIIVMATTNYNVVVLASISE